MSNSTPDCLLLWWEVIFSSLFLFVFSPLLCSFQDLNRRFLLVSRMDYEREKRLFIFHSSKWCSLLWVPSLPPDFSLLTTSFDWFLFLTLTTRHTSQLVSRHYAVCHFVTVVRWDILKSQVRRDTMMAYPNYFSTSLFFIMVN